MSNLNPVDKIPKPLNAKEFKFAIVVSRYNSIITKALLKGALGEFAAAGATVAKKDVVWVPGGFEIPLAVSFLLMRGGLDGIVTLGCIMKGETTHNEYIAAEVTRGIGSLALQYNVPVTFGVLTPDTVEQALDRSQHPASNKGIEAARAAVEMAILRRKLLP